MAEENCTAETAQIGHRDRRITFYAHHSGKLDPERATDFGVTGFSGLPAIFALHMVRGEHDPDSYFANYERLETDSEGLKDLISLCDSVEDDLDRSIRAVAWMLAHVDPFVAGDRNMDIGFLIGGLSALLSDVRTIHNHANDQLRQNLAASSS